MQELGEGEGRKSPSWSSCAASIPRGTVVGSGVHQGSGDGQHECGLTGTRLALACSALVKQLEDAIELGALVLQHNALVLQHGAVVPQDGAVFVQHGAVVPQHGAVVVQYSPMILQCVTLFFQQILVIALTPRDLAELFTQNALGALNRAQSMAVVIQCLLEPAKAPGKVIEPGGVIVLGFDYDVECVGVIVLPSRHDADQVVEVVDVPVKVAGLEARLGVSGHGEDRTSVIMVWPGLPGIALGAIDERNLLRDKRFRDISGQTRIPTGRETPTIEP